MEKKQVSQKEDEQSAPVQHVTVIESTTDKPLVNMPADLEAANILNFKEATGLLALTVKLIASNEWYSLRLKIVIDISRARDYAELTRSAHQRKLNYAANTIRTFFDIILENNATEPEKNMAHVNALLSLQQLYTEQ